MNSSSRFHLILSIHIVAASLFTWITGTVAQMISLLPVPSPIPFLHHLIHLTNLLRYCVSGIMLGAPGIHSLAGKI